MQDVEPVREISAAQLAESAPSTLFRSLAKLGLFDWNLSNNCITWSDELFRIYGYEPGTAATSLDFFLSHVHPEDQERVRQATAATLSGKGPFHHVERIRRADGQTRLVESRGRLITDSSGGHPRLIGACLDVTELERTEQLLQSILSSVTDAIVVIDDDGKILLCNPATASLLALDDSQLIGRPIEALLPSIGFDPSDIGAPSSLRPPLFSLINRTHALHLRRADGSELPVEVTITHMTLNDRDLFVAVVRDVSEQMTLRAQLEQSQRIEAVGRLAGGIAHDFNNLLTVIVGSNDLLLMSLPENHALREHAEAIRAAAQRAGYLTKQLVAFSRKQVMNTQVLNVNDVIRNAEALLRRAIRDDIAFVTQLANDVCPVKADPNQLEQVLLNLVINARDAMPAGGTLTIAARNWPQPGDRRAISPAELDRSWVEICLTDTGTGIANEVLPHIFEPFFSTKDANKGSGLGLAVAHGIIEQMGGKILAESIPGEGATLRILLPTTRNVGTSPLTGAATTLRGGNETILIVDDDQAVRSIIRRALSVHGYRVLSAASPLEAIEIAQQLDNLHGSQLDLLVTDLVMPVMSGKQLAEILRRKNHGLGVIYVSGNAPLEFDPLNDDDEFLSKPFFPVDLARTVRTHLDRIKPAR